MIAMAHQTTRSTLMEMFADNTAGESTFYNRLLTKETDDGNTSLIAYGWLKLAEYNESREAVTVFTGHQALQSTAVSRWLNQVVSVSEDRGRDVILSGESPTVDTPNDGTRYIGNYIGSGKNSPVEKDVVDNVRESLAHLS
jgi:hypothetical protein